MMMQFNSILLDFDGVIVDTVKLKIDAFIHVYGDEGQRHAEQITQYALENGGMSRRLKFAHFESVLFGRGASGTKLDELCSAYGIRVDADVERAPFISGARESIRDMRVDHSLHVVSGAPEADVIAELHRRGIFNDFASVAGAPSLKFDAFQRILKDDGRAPQEALAVGDSLTEFHAAQKLGIPFLAVIAAGAPSQFPPNVPCVADLRDLRQNIMRLGRDFDHMYNGARRSG